MKRTIKSLATVVDWWNDEIISDIDGVLNWGIQSEEMKIRRSCIFTLPKDGLCRPIKTSLLAFTMRKKLYVYSYHTRDKKSKYFIFHRFIHGKDEELRIRFESA